MIGAFAASLTDDEAAVDLHQLHADPQAAFDQCRLQLVEVRRHHRLARGVQDGGHHPLVLAVDRGELGRQGQRQLGRQLGDGGGRRLLVDRVLERPQEAHGDGVDAQVEEPLDAGSELVRIGLAQHVAVDVDALGHLDDAVAAHELRGRGVQVGVARGAARRAGDPQRVLEAGGGEQPDPREPQLVDHVGDDRVAQDELVDRGEELVL